MRLLKVDCEVDYDGRGSTRRGRGVRLLILKDDGSFLIHRSTGVKPVNYMTDVINVTESASTDGQSIISVESKKGEIIDVTIYEIFLDMTIPMTTDTAKSMVNGTERQLQEWLSRDDHWSEYVGQDSYCLGRELKTVNGSIDLIGYRQSTQSLIIVEVKRRAKKNDVYQVLRYQEAILNAERDGQVEVILQQIKEMIPSDDPRQHDLTPDILSRTECWIISEAEHDGTGASCSNHGVHSRVVGSNWWGQTIDNTKASKTAKSSLKEQTLQKVGRNLLRDRH